MTKLADLFDLEDLEWHYNERYITKRFHPTEPLAILNYSDKTQFNQKWDDVTVQCRGLIYNTETEEVVARGYRKFFNLGDVKAAWMEFNAPVEITDKVDGSLGILYSTRDGYAVATRGSFVSDQANHATELWNTLYKDFVTVTEGYSYLFEIVYPMNRIVVSYGDRDELVLLGAIENATGNVMGPMTAAALLNWPGETTKVQSFNTISDMLGQPHRLNAEGFVIRQSNKMVKYKYPDYIDLHRIIFSMSEKWVWAALANGKSVDQLYDGIPDEFYDFIKQTAGGLQEKFNAIKSTAEQKFLEIQATKPVDRRAFAMLASKTDQPSIQFALLDGKPIDSIIWKSLKPVGETTVKKVDIDNE